MKKSLLAIALTAALLGGCASTDGSNYMAEGDEVSKVEYVVTPITALEKVRMPIRSLFDAGKGIYDDYMTKALSNKDYHTFLKMTEGQSEEELKNTFNSLPPESQKNITDFDSANGEITGKLIGLGLELAGQKELFASLDPKSMLMEAGVNFMELPAALGAIKNTYNELDYLTGTISQVKIVSDTLTAMKLAE